MWVNPRARHSVEQFYMDDDCAVLFGVVRCPSHFNDELIGRALLKLFQVRTG